MTGRQRQLYRDIAAIIFFAAVALAVGTVFGTLVMS